jgi:hypothetical protein
VQRLTKFKEKAFLACLKADWLNTAANWLNGMKIIGGEVLHTPDGIIINPFMSSGSGSTIDWSLVCFGFRIDGATVQVTGGEVQIGTIVHSLGDWNVPIGEDYSFIGIEYDLSGATYIGPSSSPSVFRSEAGKARLWLHQFRYDSENEAASLYRIGHVGNVEAPGNFA